MAVIARALALVVVSASLARADAPKPTTAAADRAPDPAVEDAADANLETITTRRGLTFAATVGGGLIIGFGIKDSVGRGGSLSLRLGHVATRRTVITFELGVIAALHKPDVTGSTETNTDANLLAGAQYYVNPSLWLRCAGGIGTYTGRKVMLATGTGNLTLTGPVVLGGLGIDVMRFKSVVLGVELGTSAMVNRDGVLVASGLNLGLSFD